MKQVITVLIVVLSLCPAMVGHGQGIIERGRVYARRPIPVSIEFSGVISSYAKSGVTVSRGDILVETSVDEFNIWLEETEITYQHQLMTVALEKSKLVTTKSVSGANISIYNAELLHAKLVLSTMREGMTPEQKRKADIDIELLHIDIAGIEEDLARQQRLVTKKFAIESSLESFNRLLFSKKTALKTAQANLRLRLQGVEEDILVEQEAEVQRLSLKVKRHERRNALLVKEKEMSIAHSQADVDKTKFSIDKRTRESALATMRSAVDGIFFLRKVKDWMSPTGWREHQSGDKRWSGDIVGDVINSKALQIEVFVHEADVPALKVGMPVNITIPALKGIQIAGELSDVSQLGKDLRELVPIGTTTDLTQQAYFRVLVDLKNSDYSLVVGMSAICHFDTDDAGKAALKTEANE